MRFIRNDTGAKKRASVFLLLLSLLLPLCGQASSVSAVPAYMRVGMVMPENELLHPLTATNRDLVSVLGLVYESLVKLDDNQQPVAELGHERIARRGDKHRDDRAAPPFAV